ncbi:hypothetical protein [Pontibacter cellulosilyticus]|uniref:Uncharacterized protein n=1 Tax=Pontibacter cellulosilyticus TaxID=1720253 RepID=A0A923SK35_9BACT|nr:hypothetical protein [Pontibacter cellulosilyticus]MBC5994463.1 hypothetical protein [Pontibacter cellulosilyticus]
MAEINIERKKRPVWPWLLLIVILALLGWAIYELVTENTVVEEEVEVGYVMPAGTLPLLV